MRDTDPRLHSMSKRTWYEIKNVAADTVEVFIYDQIGEDWYTGEGVTAKRFIAELGQISAPNIDLHLNSPGGSVFDGLAIYNALVRHPAQVTTYIDGLAASIASVIALAGERVVMSSNALFMIHNPMSSVAGYSTDMRKMADVLDKIRDSIVGIYQEHTLTGRDELVAAMDAETWYTADEAVDAGFATETMKAMPIAAAFDLSAFGFKHAPAPQIAAQADEAEVVEQVEELAVDTQSPDEAGSADSDTSDGASEDTQSEAYVPGVGFVPFNRKR